MANNKLNYTEIARAQVTDTREVVISNCSKGGFTIAQVMSIKECDGITPVYMKGAIHVANVDSLRNLRDAITLAIKKLESDNSEHEAWD